MPKDDDIETPYDLRLVADASFDSVFRWFRRLDLEQWTF